MVDIKNIINSASEEWPICKENVKPFGTKLGKTLEKENILELIAMMVFQKVKKQYTTDKKRHTEDETWTAK